MPRRHVPLVLALLVPAILGTVSPADQDDILEIKGWGRVIDPDADCKFSIEKGQVAITIPGTVHALSAELGRVNAPRILQEVEGDFIVQVKVTEVSPPGSTSMVSDRLPFRSAGLLLWQDDGTFIRLERARMDSRGRDLTFGNFELRKDHRFERAGDASECPLDGEGSYLRLERRDGIVIGSVSSDGIRWTSLKPLKIDLPRTVQVGVAAIHNTPTVFEPHFEGFKVYR